MSFTFVKVKKNIVFKQLLLILCDQQRLNPRRMVFNLNKFKDKIEKQLNEKYHAKIFSQPSEG